MPKLVKASAKLVALEPVRAAFHPKSLSRRRKKVSTLWQSSASVTEVKSSKKTVKGKISTLAASCHKARLQRLKPWTLPVAPKGRAFSARTTGLQETGFHTKTFAKAGLTAQCRAV